MQPPGRATVARPVRASKGPKNKNEARSFRACSSATAVPDRAPFIRRCSFFQSARPPKPRRISAISSASAKRGTLTSSTVSSVRAAAAICGRMAFLAPPTTALPASGGLFFMVKHVFSSTHRFLLQVQYALAGSGAYRWENGEKCAGFRVHAFLPWHLRPEFSTKKRAPNGALAGTVSVLLRHRRSRSLALPFRNHGGKNIREERAVHGLSQ